MAYSILLRLGHEISADMIVLPRLRYSGKYLITKDNCSTYLYYCYEPESGGTK